jgi:hypothetical protein
LKYYEAEYGINDARRTDFQLYYGSCFNDDRGMFDSYSTSEDKIDYVEEKFDWLEEFEEEIKATRFDLEVQR